MILASQDLKILSPIISRDWLQDAELLKQDANRKVSLLLDNALPYAIRVLPNTNMETFFLPPKTSSKIQPTYVVIIAERLRGGINISSSKMHLIENKK